eukprot:154269-Chlamydomonas_euryale.AAC.1
MQHPAHNNHAQQQTHAAATHLAWHAAPLADLPEERCRHRIGCVPLVGIVFEHEALVEARLVLAVVLVLPAAQGVCGGAVDRAGEGGGGKGCGWGTPGNGGRGWHCFCVEGSWKG